jgi:nucleoside-diphosphate-sugar epimerase
VDEDSPADPVHWTGRLVLEGERVLARSGLSGTVVRLGGIYGPGRTALIDRVRSGRARCREGAPRYTNRIHRDDAAGLFCYLIELELSGAVLEPLYLGVDEEPADECVVLRWLAARLGVPPPAVAPAAGGDSSRERRSGSKRCRSDRIRRLGYRFRYRSFRDGYAALIDAG